MQDFVTDWAAAPQVTVIASQKFRRHRLATLIDGAGGAVIGTFGLAEAGQRLAERRPTGLVVMAIGDGEAEAAAPILAAAVAETDAEGQAMILSASASVLDEVAAAGLASHVTWLCDASPEEEAAALAIAMSSAAPALADISTELDPIRLRRLADEVSRIARTLSNLSLPTSNSYLAEAPTGFVPEPSDHDPSPLPSAEEVRGVLRLRRMRDQFFDAALFADPAWDMLLDLLAARLERSQVAVSSLCIAAAVPPTTALRWIKTMTDHGLFERCADPDDGRRIFIRLSDTASQAMARYFAATKRITGAMPLTI